MNVFVGGVDGGQTSTNAAIADGNGRILGRGDGPAADLVGEHRNSDRQRAAIAQALEAAMSAAGLSSDTRLAAVVVGLTGHDGDPRSAPGLAPSADAVAIVHDAVIAHAGAFGGEAGIVVLAGTGSVALGNAAPGEPYVRAGGWGYFFGDHGGALGIAREAIAWAMQDADRGEASQLGAAALRFFGASDLHAIQHAFASGELSRPALAAFAAHALAMAPTERPSMPMQAWFLRSVAVRALTELAWAIDDRLPAVPVRRVSYSGGVFRNEGLLRTFRSVVANGMRPPSKKRGDSAIETLPTVVSPLGDRNGFAAESLRKTVAFEPLGDPLDGALLLARGLAEGKPVAGWAAVG
ncbi:MAG: hypothetical protein M3R44_04880 [Candidatus Eremiobacteraeota bacterium]|nr:hypothetical protein [Candidatus Eremiobacteraeota bacterium]